jgi:hypothetical protein
LPGASILRVPPVGDDHSSVWITRVVSPANFFAKDGSPPVRWTWSLLSVKPSPSRSRVMSSDTTSRASPTFFRKAGSASISKTSAGLASYDSSWRNFMEVIMSERRN